MVKEGREGAAKKTVSSIFFTLRQKQLTLWSFGRCGRGFRLEKENAAEGLG